MNLLIQYYKTDKDRDVEFLYCNGAGRIFINRNFLLVIFYNLYNRKSTELFVNILLVLIYVKFTIVNYETIH